MTKSPLALPSILKKSVMSITGIALVGFVILHLLGNLQFFAGPEAINAYAHTMQTLPAPIKWGGRLTLLAIVLVHIVIALKVVSENRLARPESYAESRHQRATAGSRTMPLTGLLLIAFITFHLLHFTVRSFGDYNGLYGGGWTLQEGALAGTKVMDVYAMMIAGFKVPLVSISYLIAMALLCLHLMHGVQSLFQTLGLMSRQWRGRAQVVSMVLAVAIFVGYAAIPFSIIGGQGAEHMKRYEVQHAAAGAAESTTHSASKTESQTVSQTGEKTR